MEERWRTHIDKIIEEATERGQFDLPHLRGKPLREDFTEIHAGDRAMAHKILRNSGYAPPFLMKKREIDERLEVERKRLRRYALRRKHLQAQADAASDASYTEALRARAEGDWAWAIAQFEKALPWLNEHIGLFNLMNQIPNLHKMKIRMDWEIERMEKQLSEADES